MESTGPKPVHLLKSVALDINANNVQLPPIATKTSSPIPSPSSSKVTTPSHSRPSSPLRHVIPRDHHLRLEAQTSSPTAITSVPISNRKSPVAIGKMLHQACTSSILTSLSLHAHHESDDFVDPTHTLWNVRKESHRTMHYHHKLHQKKGCYV